MSRQLKMYIFSSLVLYSLSTKQMAYAIIFPITENIQTKTQTNKENSGKIMFDLFYEESTK